MTVVIADVIGGAAMACGGWCFSQLTHVNGLLHKIHDRTSKLEMKLEMEK